SDSAEAIDGRDVTGEIGESNALRNDIGLLSLIPRHLDSRPAQELVEVRPARKRFGGREACTHPLVDLVRRQLLAPEQRTAGEFQGTLRRHPDRVELEACRDGGARGRLGGKGYEALRAQASEWLRTGYR